MSSSSYSESEYSDEDSYSESESSHHRKKKKDKKHSVRKKDKKRSKKEKKKSKKEKKRRKDRKKDRGRRRSPSCSDSDSRSDSLSRSSPRNGGRRQNGDRGRPREDARRDPPAYRTRQRSRSRSRGMAASAPYPAPRRSPFKMPEDGRALTLAEACEAAGRGVATGQTVRDDDVTVYGPDEEKFNADRFDSFDEVKDFPRELREEIRNAGFPAPSQIQAWTWPLSLRGKDIIGIAATGSGKTLAFLLPAFVQMGDEGVRPERDGAGLLVMSPTRELAQQTEAEANRFGRCLGFRCVAMYGGTPKMNQMQKYRQGCHTIVACPGRLNDFLEGGQIRLDGIMKLVLDEADRMLDMGFEPQIRKILSKVPRKRHTLFFTATWPREVRKLASEILTRPYKVMIGNRDELKGNQDITQSVRILDLHAKNTAIIDLLREAGLMHRDSCGKALVFCNTKRMCDQLAQFLSRTGVACTAIHGDKDQVQRDDALNGLKSGRVKVLVATDVAARGLDIKGVGLVVNFDPANNTEDYVHRIGRTGRAGAKGYAITFLTGAEGHKARGIIEVMERNHQDVRPELRALAGSAGAGGGRGGGRDRFGPMHGMAALPY